MAKRTRPAQSQDQEKPPAAADYDVAAPAKAPADRTSAARTNRHRRPVPGRGGRTLKRG